MTQPKSVANGIDLIEGERMRQRLSGRDDAHDDKHDGEELVYAAACYLLTGNRIPDSELFHGRYWPWNITEFRPSPDNRLGELVKAGALIVAEIDRLLRAGAIEHEAKPIRELLDHPEDYSEDDYAEALAVLDAAGAVLDVAGWE